MSTTRQSLNVCAIVWATLMVPWHVAANESWSQGPRIPEAPGVVSAESIPERLRQLASAKNLDGATTATIRDLLQQTLEDTEATKRWIRLAEEYGSVARSASADAANDRRTLERLQSVTRLPVPDDLNVAELRERLVSRESELAQLRAALRAAEQEPSRRSARRRVISQRLTELPKRAASIEAQLEADLPPSGPTELTAARRDYLTNRRHAIQRQIEALESERKAYDATVDLLPLRRRLAALQLERAELEVDQLRRAIARLKSSTGSTSHTWISGRVW